MLSGLLRTAVVACLTVVSRSTSAQSPVEIPATSGPFPVGMRRYEWVDSTRTEVVGLFRRDSTGTPRATAASGPRRLVVQLWYPAARASVSAARAPYNPSAKPFAGVLRDTARIRLYAALSGRAALNANAVAGQRFPLLVFSPGSAMFTEDYTYLLEEIASHGYVVAAVGHPGTSLVAFSDGAFGVETAWRPPPTLSMDLALDSLRKSWAFFRDRDQYLTEDINEIVRRLANRRQSPMADVVDTTRIGFLGHSTGGAVVTTAIRSRTGRGRHALIVYDVFVPTLLFEAPLVSPFLLFRTTAKNYPQGWSERLLGSFDGIRGDGFDAVVTGGTHQGFSDKVLLMAPDTAAAAAARNQHRATSALTMAFIDHYLKGRGQAVLADSSKLRELNTSVRKVRSR